MADVLFVMRYPLERPEPLKAKFDGQMAAMAALGHRAYCLGWDRRGVWLLGGEKPVLLQKARFSALPGYSHTLLYVDMMAALKKAAAQRFQLVYLRYMPTFFNAPGAICAVKQSGARLVVEHPTYPFQNGKTTSALRRPMFWLWDRCFARINPMIDLYTLIGEPGGDTLCGRPAMNIVNGVDVSLYPRHAPRPQDPQVHLLAVASMSCWQGYDRLIRAMAASAQPMVLHMVGGEGDGSLAQWKQLARELNVEDRVLFEGEKYGSELDEMAARCDVGVGGLGLYRKGQHRSMTLKLREYMARGLPFLYAVDDPAIPGEPRFCLRLPNDDSLPDMDAIAAFGQSAKRDNEAPDQMRAYAREHMSWKGVWRPVLKEVDIPCQEP